MNNIKYQTNLHEALFDLLNFIEEQVQRAKADNDEQEIAIDSARGVVPFLRERVFEDPELNAKFMLIFDDQMFSAHWKEWWIKLEKMPPSEFQGRADKLISQIAILKDVLRAHNNESSWN